MVVGGGVVEIVVVGVVTVVEDCNKRNNSDSVVCELNYDLKWYT